VDVQFILHPCLLVTIQQDAPSALLPHLSSSFTPLCKLKHQLLETFRGRKAGPSCTALTHKKTKIEKFIHQTGFCLVFVLNDIELPPHIHAIKPYPL